MSRRSTRPSPARAVMLALGVATVVAACAGGAASPSPAASDARTFAPTLPPSAAPSAPAGSTVPSSGPTGSAASSLPRNGRIALPDAGFAITLPATWTRLGPDADDIARGMAERGSADRMLIDQLAGHVAMLADSGLVLFAIGPELTAGHNLSVLRDEAAGMSLDLLENLSLTQLRTTQPDVQHERVGLPAGEASHLFFDVPVDASGTTLRVDQFLLLTGAHQLTLSVTAPSADDALAIAESIELLAD